MSKILTEFTINNQDNEAVAFELAVEKAEEWYSDHDEYNIPYSFRIKLISKEYIYYDNGDGNYYEYTFQLKEY